MAIFHVKVKTFSRSKGHTATGVCAYRLGLNMVNEETGQRYNFSKRQDVVEAFTLLPKGSPEWEPLELWNEAEKSEKRNNSCVGREVMVALPYELSEQERSETTKSIAYHLVEKYGVAVSVGIHEPDDGGLNHRAHILMSARRLTPKGFGEKTREWDDKTQGPKEVLHVREFVANALNMSLERAGVQDRVSHLSLEFQRDQALDDGDFIKALMLDRLPTKHEGRMPEVRKRVQAENKVKREAHEKHVLDELTRIEEKIRDKTRTKL